MRRQKGGAGWLLPAAPAGINPQNQTSLILRDAAVHGARSRRHDGKVVSSEIGSDGENRLVVVVRVDAFHNHGDIPESGLIAARGMSLSQLSFRRNMNDA